MDRSASVWGTAVIAFQLVGWVLIVLFFGAMIGGHKSAPDHYFD